MPETRTEVRPILIGYTCDDCGEPMTATGTILTVAPLLYRHECQNGHRLESRERYGSLRWEPLHPSTP